MEWFIWQNKETDQPNDIQETHITKLQDSRVIISLVAYYYAAVNCWTLMESQKFMSETEAG